MIGLWAYPWSLAHPSFDQTMERLAAAGIDHLKLGAHYHSVRTFDPKTDRGFVTFPGGCLFEPDLAYFKHTPIEPPTTDQQSPADPFGEAVDAAREHGIGVDAWLVCFHGTRLASAWPSYQIQDVFGGTHEHALCPSHPEVRAYFTAVVRNLAQYDVERIDLESVGFPSVVHDHGATFGHHKDHVITTRADEFLLSQCFCDGCRHAAERRDIVDFQRAESTVVELCKRFLSTHEETPTLSALVSAQPILADLFAFRAAVIGDLLEALTRASGDARLSYYLADGGGYTPSTLWPSGVTLEHLHRHLEDVTVLCYTDDQTVIDRRLTACEAAFEVFDVGLTPDPSVLEEPTQWNQLLTSVADRIAGDVFVYNHALLPEAQLETLAGTIERMRSTSDH